MCQSVPLCSVNRSREEMLNIYQTHLLLTAVAPPSSAIGLKNKRTVGDQTQSQNNDLWLVVAEEEDEISPLNVSFLS